MELHRVKGSNQGKVFQGMQRQSKADSVVPTLRIVKFFRVDAMSAILKEIWKFHEWRIWRMILWSPGEWESAQGKNW